MDKREALKSLVDYEEEEDDNVDNIGDDANTTQSQSSSQSQSNLHSHSSHKIKSHTNLDTKKERHSHQNRDIESKSEPKLSDKSGSRRSQKCSTHEWRDNRHDNRHSDKKYDTNSRDSNRKHNNDRESQRHSRARRSRSRSGSRSRERYQKRDKYEDSSTTSRVRHYPSRNCSNKCDRTDNKTTNRNEKLSHAMQTMQQQIKASTGISVPNYYNVGVINPIKFAQQEQKRKLLWSRDDAKPQQESTVVSSVPTLWKNTKFEGDKGSQMTEKFRKLMGIKESSGSVPFNGSEDDAKKQENATETQETLFRNLDMQYAVARMSTHTHRGVGLGFGSSNSSTSQTPKSYAHN